MAEKLVTNIISKDAFDEVKNLSKEMDILVQKLEQAITNAKNFDAAFKSAKGVIEFEKALYNTVDAQNELIKTGEQLKDNYVKQEAAQKAVISETVNLGKSIKDTDDAIKKINSTLDAGAKVLAEQKIALEQNKKEQKDLKKELDAGRITLDQYSEKMVFLIQNEQELKVQTSQLTKAQTQFAKENISVAGSMDQAGIRIGRLREEYRTLTDEEKSSPFGKKLKSAIDDLDPAIKSADASIGNFQRNVGDYTNSINKSFKGAFGGAFNVLVTELNEIKQKLQDPALNGKAFESLSKQGALLEQVLEGVSKEFTSTRQESRAFQEAATKLGLAFDINSEQFQKFRTEVGKGVDDIKDIKDSIKLAASDTKGLDRLIGAAQGLTGAFNVAQGAAALLGDENEELQKTLVKLQAATSILNGLQAVQNELKNKDSVFSKVINFLRGQETKLTIAQTEAQAANAVATNAGAAATSRLGLAMKATGIGAILLLITGAVYVFEKLKDVIGSVSDRQKKLNEVNAEAAKNYVEELSKVQALVREAQNENTSKERKKQLIKELNDASPNYFGNIKTEDDLTGKLTTSYTKYTQALLLSSQIKAAISASSKDQVALVELQIEKQDKLSKIEAQRATFSNPALINPELGKNYNKNVIAKLDQQEKDINKEFSERERVYQKNLTPYNNYINNLNNKLAVLGGDPGKAPNVNNNNSSKKSAEDTASKNAQALFKIQEDNAKLAAELFKKQVEDESLSLNERLAAQVKYYEQQQIIAYNAEQKSLADNKKTSGEKLEIQNTYNNEIKKLSIEQTEAEYNLRRAVNQKELKDAYDIIKARIEQEATLLKAKADNENLSLLDRIEYSAEYYKKEQQLALADLNLSIGTQLVKNRELLLGRTINEEEINKLTQTTALQRQKFQEDYSTKSIQLEKDRIKQIKDIAKNDIVTNSDVNDSNEEAKNAIKLKALDELYLNGEILLIEYEERKKKLQEKYDKEKIAREIETTKRLIQIALENPNTSPTEKAALLAKLAKLEEMYAALSVSIYTETSNSIKEKLKELYGEVAKLFETSVLAGYDREKNEIQDQINAREEQKTKEIEAVNAEGISAQEKANKIAIINARAQAQKEQLERRQRQIDLERAKFERAFNIGQIIAKTALGVVGQLSYGNFITAALIAAIGAVQLATVLAQPLPKFAKGTKDSGKAQFSIVGEEGTELLEMTDGKKFLTPNEPTITFLPAHTKVIPNNELMLQKARETALYNSLKPIEYNVNNTQQQLKIEKLENLMQQTVSAIKSKPVAHITNTWKGVETSYQGVNGWTKYINRYINS